MSVRGHLVDDMETETKPTSQLVQVFSSTVYNKVLNAGIISKLFPYKLSFICSLAYLANFQYDIANSYIAAITLCDRIISIAHQTAANYRFVELDSFPVLFTAQQIRVFDVEIQAVFGFVTLVRMLRRESRQIVVGICPLLFVYYIKCRCLLRLNSNGYAIADTFEKLFRHSCSVTHGLQDSCYYLLLRVAVVASQVSGKK